MTSVKAANTLFGYVNQSDLYTESNPQTYSEPGKILNTANFWVQINLTDLYADPGVGANLCPDRF